MRRIEMVATVLENGLLTLSVPTDVAPGKHIVVVEIDEQALAIEHNETDWHAFVQETSGAWRGDFERMPHR